MTPTVGNDRARNAFFAALAGGSLHHAWLLTGPQGVGKGRFAREAALRLLEESAQNEAARAQAASMIEAGSHPDYRVLERLPKDTAKVDGDRARSITIDQVRRLQPLFATTPSLSTRRVVVIDAVDDLERGGANALLKNLEEPPSGTVFLLVSHAPGRLLPTIRSRCRVLRFEPLGEEEMRHVLRAELPEADVREIEALAEAGECSPGRALRFAGLELAALDRQLAAIAQDGDPSNAKRFKLAKSLSAKSAQPRYEAFLDRAPAFVATQARGVPRARLRPALDAFDAARNLAASARALSLDQQGTVFEMAGIVARLADG